MRQEEKEAKEGRPEKASRRAIRRANHERERRRPKANETKFPKGEQQSGGGGGTAK